MSVIDRQTLLTLLAKVAKDLSLLDQSSPFAIFDLEAQDWVLGPAGFDEPSEYGREGYVACVAGSQTLVDGATEAALVIEVISVIQENLVDVLGYWWPEFQPAGQFAGILEPDLVGGEILWALKGAEFERLGELHTRGSEIRSSQR